MESRKVQLTGNSTFTVSLPKPWATEQGIEAGQEVSLYTYGEESLVLKPCAAGPEGDLSASVLVPDALDDASLAMAVSSLYVGGYDRVILLAESEFSPAQRRAVAREVRTLIGLEVVETDADRLELRNLLDPGEVSIRQTLVQLRMTVLSSHRMAVESLFDDAEPTDLGSGEADRLHALLGRTFRRSLRCIEELDRLDADPARLFDYYAAAHQLERVGTIAAGTATRAADAEATLPVEAVERVRAAGDDSRTVVEQAITAVADGSVDPAYEALELHWDLASNLDALDRELAGADLEGAYHLGVLVDRLRRTGTAGVAIARVALQSPSWNDSA